MTVDSDPSIGAPAPARRRGGPLLPAPAAAYGALTVATVVIFQGPLPGDGAAAALATLQAQPVQGAVWAALLVGSAAPLAVWTAAVCHRLRSLGARVAGPLIGLVGGVLAAVCLLLSGLVGWTAIQSAPLGDAPLVRALSTLSFGAGGVGFALGSALLLAGVAVPSLILRLVPRGVAVAGLVLAVAGALSPLVLVLPVLAPLLPVVRFGGLLWLIVVSVLLPVSRRREPTRGEHP